MSTKNYYPFGMLWEGGLSSSPKMQYGYNGKELDTDFGLNVHFYGARLYDSALNRFTGVDPLADIMPSWSGYSYSFNNPIRFVDRDGRMPSVANGPGDPAPSVAGVLFEAFQNARAGLFNMEMRAAEFFGAGDGKSITRMRVNYDANGFIPIDNPVSVGQEAKKGALAETGDAVLDVLSLSPLAELGAARGAMSAPFLAAKSGVGSGITSIFRAVSSGELDDIMDSGLIRPGRNTMEVKLFTENVDDAMSQGLATGKKFSIIEATIPNSTLNQLEVLHTVDKHIMTGNTIAVQPDKLDLFNSTLQSVNKIQ